jgi:hypothetical protein
MLVRLRLCGIHKPPELARRIVLVAQLLHFFFPRSPWSTVVRVSRDYVRAHPGDRRTLRALLDSYVVAQGGRIVDSDPTLSLEDAQHVAAVALWDTHRRVMGGGPP